MEVKETNRRFFIFFFLYFFFLLAWLITLMQILFGWDMSRLHCNSWDFGGWKDQPEKRIKNFYRALLRQAELTRVCMIWLNGNQVNDPGPRMDLPICNWIQVWVHHGPNKGPPNQAMYSLHIYGNFIGEIKGPLFLSDISMEKIKISVDTC